MNYYPFNISDFSNATKHLTILEKAIYRELLDLYYDKESPLENNPEMLARKICAREHPTVVEQVLNEFFTLDDGCWKNATCERVIADYRKKLESASKAGKASARARAKNSKASRDSTVVERPLNGGATNQEPITKNQEPYIIPDGINLEAWQEWETYRKSKKKKISKAAANKQFKLLLKHSPEIQADIINKSIQNDYQGLFEPKNKIESDIPYQAIAESYNENFAKPLQLGELVEITDIRKAMISKIWGRKPDDAEKPTNTVDHFNRYFAYCSTVQGLNSEINGYMPTIDRLLKYENYIKAIEGGYK